MIAADLAPSHNSANTKAQNAARKFPRLESFLKTSNCYPTEGPNSGFEEIYLLVRFTVMVIIVTVKNAFIVSSELPVLHRHDLIPPLNGAGIVNSAFQKEDAEVHCSPMPRARPHMKRGREEGTRRQASTI